MNDSDELLEDVGLKSEFEKQKELARLKRLRKESFMLTPPRSPISRHQNRFDDELVDELDEIDRENNNYMQHNQADAGNVRNRKDNSSSSGLYSLSESSPSRPRTISDIKKDFQLGDVIDFVHQGLQVKII